MHNISEPTDYAMWSCLPESSSLVHIQKLGKILTSALDIFRPTIIKMPVVYACTHCNSTHSAEVTGMKVKRQTPEFAAEAGFVLSHCLAPVKHIGRWCYDSNDNITMSGAPRNLFVGRKLVDGGC